MYLINYLDFLLIKNKPNNPKALLFLYLYLIFKYE